MKIVEIIEKKIKNQELNKQELSYAFNGYLNGDVKDYQMSSLLMAILLNGMTDEELFIYTELLINSGDKIVFNDNEKRVDKHSTGGIGDKVSLILSPILAANDIHIGKISGRGLGFTGGTIDKLESIEGFNVNLTLKQFISQSEQDGISLMNTSSKFAPLDKVIYALRDVTGTVSSKHLIAASIMSKKLLTNSKYIFIDLKCGDGAFFKIKKEADEIVELFKKIALKFERELIIFVTDMDAPLGNYVGNWLEVYESIELLKGKMDNNALKLAKKIASKLIAIIYDMEENKAYQQVEQSITSGKAFERFDKWIKNQNGIIDYDALEESSAKYQYIVKSPESGYVSYQNILKIGYGLNELGGGRMVKEDAIDAQVGFKFLFEVNDYVEQYEETLVIFSNKELSPEFVEKIESTIVINSEKVDYKLIIDEL